MKTEQKFAKKLMLNKETIRVLSDNELMTVAGATAGNGCGTNTCNTCLLSYPCYSRGVCTTKNVCGPLTSPIGE